MNVDKTFDRQTELNNCTFVKTVLMILVVLYHSMAFWTGGWFTAVLTDAEPGLTMVTRWMNTFHIYGFALVSGYLFYYLKEEKQKYAEFWPFVVNKAKRLLIPYLFVSVIWVIPVGFFFYRYDALTILKNYALAQSPSQLWFLVMLFFVFVIF